MEINYKLLAQKRKEKGLTQAELGTLLGVSGMAISKWERGLAFPCPEHQAQLINLLGLEAEKEFDESEQTTPNETGRTNKVTFLSTMRREFLRILSAGTLLGICVCRLFGTVSIDTAVVCFGVSGIVFCLGTLLKAVKEEFTAVN